MADRIEKILLQLDIDTSQLVINLQKANDKIELLQKQQATARLELKKMEEAGIQTGATYDNLVRQINGFDVSLKVASDEARNYTKQLKLVEQANKSQEGSLNEQKALLSILTAQYNQLSEEERLNSEAGKKLGAEILKITDNLKAQEQAVGNARRNVGNYQAAITAAFESFNKAKGNVNDVKLAIDQLNQKFREGGISEQQYNTEIGQLNQQLQESQSETDILGQKLDDLKNIVTENGEGFKSLRQRLREARDEATLAQDKFSAGLIDEKQLVSAQQKVADLSEEVSDFNKRVEALNPEAKFKAFTQVASGLAGGIGAVSGAVGLLGGESEDAAQALLKVQQFMQFTQGLNQLAELGDAFKSLRIVLGFTTVATQANTIAEGKNVIAKEANIVVTEATVVAEEAATVATKGLTASMAGLAVPLTVLAIVAGGVLAAFDAFGETEFAGQTRDIAEAVKQENTEHERTIKLLSDVNRSQVTQAENALKQAQANKQLQLSKATTTTEKEQIVKNTAPEIQGLENELLRIKLDALAKEEDENKKHLLNLQFQRDNAGIERITGATQEARDAAAKAEQEANNEIDAIREKNAAITNEERKLNTELLLIPKQREQERIQQEKDFDNRRKDALNQASLIRIGLIKDAEEMELEAEREQSKQKIVKLLEDEKANSELIIAEKQASQQRILDIVKKFALQDVQERNALEVALTVEGTQARIDAEIFAAKRLRDELLKNDRLTFVERQRIQADAENKLIALESNRVNLLQDQANAEVDVERRKQIAIQDIRSRQANSPTDQFEAERIRIEENFKFQIDELNKANEEKVNAIADQANREVQLNIQNATEQERNTKEFKDRQQAILDKANDKIIASDQATNEERKQLFLQSGQDLVDITEKRFVAESQLKVLSLQRTESELNTELASVQKGSQREIELRKQLELVKNEITREGINARLSFLKFELEAGRGLTEKEYAEYLLLLQKMKEASAEATQVSISASLDQIKLIVSEASQAIGALEGIYNAAHAQSQRQAEQRLNQIQSTLDAELAAIDERQAKEEGTFVKRTASQEKYDQLREDARNKAADQERRIKLRQFKADQDAAAIQAAIKGAVAFVEALPNYYLAALVALSTAAEISIIEGQQPPEFSKGGFTGYGNPKNTSLTLGRKPYTYHLNEYVIPDPVLSRPDVKNYVHGVLEPIRMGTMPSVFGVPVSSPSQRSFESGGFAQVPLSSTTAINIQQVTAEEIKAIVGETVSQMKVSVAVQDISEQQGIVTKVEGRANH